MLPSLSPALGIDLIEHPTGREELLLRARPAAEVGDGGEVDLRILRGELRRDFRITRAIEIAGDDLLPFLAVEVLKVRRGQWPLAMLQGVLVDDGDRRLREDTGRRIDDREAIARLLTNGEQRLVLPTDEHVPQSMLRERRR